MKGELHTEERVLIEPEATTSDQSKPQVSISSLLLSVFLGGKLVMHLIKKKAKVSGMHGISAGRPHEMKRMSVCHKTVARPYGGNLTGTEVKDRIMRAFLIDEFKYFKMMSKVSGDKKDKKKKKSGDKKAKAKK